MKTLILTFIMLLPFSSIFGQKDKVAKEVLDKVVNLLHKEGDIQASFSTSVYQNNSIQSETMGVLWLKNESFVLETKEMKTWYNGKYQWSLIFDMEEVNISEPTEEELMEINPYQLLKLYKKGYIYALGDKTSKSQEVILKSQDKNKNFQIIRIWIDTNSYEPTSLEVLSKDKSLTKIKITEFKKKLNLSNSFFKFHQTEYPDVEIIDLR